MFAMLGGALRDGEDVAALAAEQAAAGLAVVTDGRPTVPDDAAEASRLADGLLAGRGSGAVERWAAASAGTAASDGADRPEIAIAATLPGPWSLARRAAGGVRPDDGVSPDAALALALADALGREAAALAAAGCPLARVDEPDAAVAAATGEGGVAASTFHAAHAALVTASGPGSADPPHLTLALTGGDHRGLGAGPLADLGYRSYLFDLIAGPDDWRLIALLPGDRGIVCGVVDAATDLGDAPEILVWAAHYAASTGRRGLARVGLATTGSLAALPPEEAAAKMRALAEGARVAALPADELAASLDPRALDMRSAAVGAWYRDPRFSRRHPRDASVDADR